MRFFIASLLICCCLMVFSVSARDIESDVKNLQQNYEAIGDKLSDTREYLDPESALKINELFNSNIGLLQALQDVMNKKSERPSLYILENNKSNTDLENIRRIRYLREKYIQMELRLLYILEYLDLENAKKIKELIKINQSLLQSLKYIIDKKQDRPSLYIIEHNADSDTDSSNLISTDSDVLQDPEDNTNEGSTGFDDENQNEPDNPEQNPIDLVNNDSSILENPDDAGNEDDTNFYDENQNELDNDNSAALEDSEGTNNENYGNLDDEDQNEQEYDQDTSVIEGNDQTFGGFAEDQAYFQDSDTEDENIHFDNESSSLNDGDVRFEGDSGNRLNDNVVRLENDVSGHNNRVKFDKNNKQSYEGHVDFAEDFDQNEVELNDNNETDFSVEENDENEVDFAEDSDQNEVEFDNDNADEVNFEDETNNETDFDVEEDNEENVNLEDDNDAEIDSNVESDDIDFREENDADLDQDSADIDADSDIPKEEDVDEEFDHSEEEEDVNEESDNSDEDVEEESEHFEEEDVDEESEYSEEDANEDSEQIEKSNQNSDISSETEKNAKTTTRVKKSKRNSKNSGEDIYEQDIEEALESIQSTDWSRRIQKSRQYAHDLYLNRDSKYFPSEEDLKKSSKETVDDDLLHSWHF